MKIGKENGNLMNDGKRRGGYGEKRSEKNMNIIKN
jgi:hypothetical protein